LSLLARAEYMTTKAAAPGRFTYVFRKGITCGSAEKR
jgi:hypothetical protein